MQQVSDNVLVYVSGYIASKISIKLCQSCRCIVTGQLGLTVDHVLLTQKQYAHCRERGLHVPSRQLVEVVKQLDVVYAANIEDIIYKQGVKACLSVLLMKTMSESLLVCPQAVCKLHQLVVDKFLNIRLHSTLKECSKTFSEKWHKRNKKVLQFTHS
jgi:hypothetical protein